MLFNLLIPPMVRAWKGMIYVHTVSFHALSTIPAPGIESKSHVFFSSLIYFCSYSVP
jgi:hypothetical protein